MKRGKHDSDEDESSQSEDYDNYDDNESDEEAEDERPVQEVKKATKTVGKDAHLPLFERLARSERNNQTKAIEAVNDIPIHSKKRLRKEHLKARDNEDHASENENDDDDDDNDISTKHKRSKHAPTVMKSNRPVSRYHYFLIPSILLLLNFGVIQYRFRLSTELPSTKFRDPRFGATDISGKLDQSKFKQSYSFLESYQEEEIKTLEKSIKKSKTKETADKLKQDLFK